MTDTKTTQEMAVDGMTQAVEHADQEEPGWSERAYQMLVGYAAHHKEFMTENVRVWATDNGLPKPPTDRAWGAVTLRAARADLIVCVGYRKTSVPPAHAAPRSLWQSQIYREAA